MSAILKYHKIGYHVYVDDTQLYISTIYNRCLSEIRQWMITNKLKINNSKTEFIVFRSPQLRCDLSSLSVNVGESQITHSLKVIDLGIIFDQFLNFDNHITAILLNRVADHRTKLRPTTSAVSPSRRCAPEPWTV